MISFTPFINVFINSLYLLAELSNTFVLITRHRIMNGINPFYNTISLDQPRIVTKIEGAIPGEIENRSRNGEIDIITMPDRRFIIEPSMGPLFEEAMTCKWTAINMRSTTEELQEMINNYIDRFQAKKQGRKIPPRYIPESLDLNPDREVSLLLKELSSEDELIRRHGSGEITLTYNDNNDKFIIITPCIGNLCKILSSKIKKRFDGKYTEDDLDEIKKIVATVLTKARRERVAYRQYKAQESH